MEASFSTSSVEQVFQFTMRVEYDAGKMLSTAGQQGKNVSAITAVTQSADSEPTISRSKPRVGVSTLRLELLLLPVELLLFPVELRDCDRSLE